MKAILLIVAIITMVGCKQEAPTHFLDVEESFLPLQIGNEWNYELSTDTNIIFYMKVINMKLINTLEYYVVINNFHNKIDTSYIRTSDGMNFYIYQDNKEYVYLIFKDTTINDGIYKSQKLNVKIRNESRDTIKTKAGNFNSYAEVEEGDISKDAGTVYLYTKGIGLLSKFWFKGKMTLVYAKVNNVEIGKKIE